MKTRCRIMVRDEILNDVRLRGLIVDLAENKPSDEKELEGYMKGACDTLESLYDGKLAKEFYKLLDQYIENGEIVTYVLK